MRFSSSEILIQFITLLFQTKMASGSLFDPAERVNDFYIIDSNLLHCAKLILQFSKNKELDTHFTKKNFISI